MTERLRAIIEQAKTLTLDERAELVDVLSGGSAEEIAKAWGDEAERRGNDADATGDHGEAWSSVRARLLAE